MGPRLVLASASSGRLGTLRAAGLDPDVLVSGVDESTVESDDPRELSAQLARLKAEAVVARMRDQPRPGKPTIVLGCDSVLELDGEIHGKPTDAGHAIARWRRMRGRTGTLHTGHCLIDVDTAARAEAVGSTEVTFADATDEEIAAYVATGEPLRVAGAFTIDSLGGWFVERISGDHGNVVGVSLPVLRRLLGELDVSIPALWAARREPAAGGSVLHYGQGYEP
jgi:septum formation protein